MKNKTITDMLNDVYQMGRTDATLNTDDWDTLKPGVLSKIQQLLEECAPDWSKVEHADNRAQEAYALGGRKAIAQYTSNLNKRIK